MVTKKKTTKKKTTKKSKIESTTVMATTDGPMIYVDGSTLLNPSTDTIRVPFSQTIEFDLDAAKKRLEEKAKAELDKVDPRAAILKLHKGFLELYGQINGAVTATQQIGNGLSDTRKEVHDMKMKVSELQSKLYHHEDIIKIMHNIIQKQQEEKKLEEAALQSAANFGASEEGWVWVEDLPWYKRLWNKLFSK